MPEHARMVGSIVEQTKIIDPLTNPTAVGLAAARVSARAVSGAAELVGKGVRATFRTVR